MQRISQISLPRSVSASTSFLSLCSLLAASALPAHAQRTDPPPGFPHSDSSGPFLGNFSHSDSSGPFLGNPTQGSTPTTSFAGNGPSISRSISTLDIATRDFLLAPFQTDLSPVSALQLDMGEVLKICVQMTTSMDKLSPFAGCANVNWKVYNRAVSDSKQLRRELNQAVGTQLSALKASQAPAERQVIGQKLALLEKTTTALEATTAVLVALGQAMDKAR